MEMKKYCRIIITVISVMNGLYEIFRGWKNHPNEEDTIFSVSALLDRINSQEKIIKRLRHKMILLGARISYRLITQRIQNLLK